MEASEVCLMGIPNSGSRLYQPLDPHRGQRAYLQEILEA